ncbi:MAG: hypothetical protein IJA55_05240 [Clostridia bacterium]|nr:hypothetical protein [Clostridia bacterium]
MENNELSSLLSGVMSNPEIMSKLSGILSDPEAMKTISGAVSGAAGEKEEKQEISALPKIPQNEDAKNRARLISALKPYLNADRRDKADKLLGLLSILELTGSANLFKRGD